MTQIVDAFLFANDIQEPALKHIKLWITFWIDIITIMFQSRLGEIFITQINIADIKWVIQDVDIQNNRYVYIFNICTYFKQKSLNTRLLQFL